MISIIYISLLILLAVLLVVAEILLLPGVTISAVGAVAAIIGAIYVAYIEFGVGGAAVVLVSSIVLSTIAILISIRKKSLNKISLGDCIDSSTSLKADTIVKVGDVGQTYTRLAPMGNIIIGGKIIEAKSRSGYIDAKTEVKIVDFEDAIVIVENIN